MNNTECLRIVAQLRNAFAGEPWHGPPLSELLAGVTAQQARSRPLPRAHSIGELVLHITIWARVTLEATESVPMPKLYHTERDWPAFAGETDAEWTDATAILFQTGEELARAIEAFSDARLSEIVPGREYDFYFLFHGIVQHSLYHGGQIAMLASSMRTNE